MNKSSILMTIVTTLIGIVGSAVVTKKFSKDKNPVWNFKLSVLFSKGISKIDNLKITYTGHEIDNLCSVNLTFWNNGKETITANDVVEPICLCVPQEYNLFNAKVVKATNESNEFQVAVSEDRRKAEITFKYMDYKQGATIQFLSDCDRVENYNLQGAIMGCRNIKKQIVDTKKWESLLSAVVAEGVTVGSLFLSTMPGEELMGRYFPLTMFILLLGFVICTRIVIKQVQEFRYRIPKRLRL